MAIHPDLRCDPGHPADRDSAVSARIAGLAGEEGGRDLETAEPGPDLQPRAAPDDHRLDVADRLRIWRGPGGHSASAADCAGAVPVEWTAAAGGPEDRRHRSIDP